MRIKMFSTALIIVNTIAKSIFLVTRQKQAGSLLRWRKTVI